MNRANGAQISGQPQNFGGIPVTSIGYSNPDVFPMGIEVVLHVPGKLEPIGRIVVPPGLVVALIGPGGAKELVASTRQARDRLAPGVTLPPGM